MTSNLPKAAYLPLEVPLYTTEKQELTSRQYGTTPSTSPLAKGCTIQGVLSIPDLETPQPVITFTSSLHTDVTITLEELAALHRMTYQTASTADELNILSRLCWSHPLHTDPGQALLKGVCIDPSAPDYPKYLVLKDDDETYEGTPILRWARKSSITDLSRINEHDGWTLGFVEDSSMTLTTTTVGFARWDRPDAVANLIQQMGDREALMVISAMMNTEATSALSAKELARTVLNDRQRTKVETKPVKAFLARHHLTSADDGISYERGRVRVLPVRLSGSKNLPIAIGILTPRRPGSREDKTAVENEANRVGGSWDVREAVRERHYSVWRTAWEARLHAAMPDLPGWRIVDLPQPTASASSRWEHVTWITPLDEELWESFAAAARREAANIQMGVGGIF